MNKKILIIQTAFIGDVILATSLIETIHSTFPEAEIDFLLRKGNENLLANNPKLNQVLIWDKKDKKYPHLYKIIRKVRKNRYDYLINVQRFLSTGLITTLSKAKYKAGFRQNPLSLFFNKKVNFEMKEGLHEIDRNNQLLEGLYDKRPSMPKLYPVEKNFQEIEEFTKIPYICIAPASKWFTKQLPTYKWLELIHLLNRRLNIYLIGGKEDIALCSEIKQKSNQNNVINLAGKLSFLSSAALMKTAKMNYVNDSAPLHIASSMNAPVTAFFLSTVKEFGFYPLSSQSTIAEIDYDLLCRPCGIHGLNKCPEGHFKCAHDIDITKYVVKENR